MPISALPKALLFKNESTYKTDASPTGAANAILLREDPTLTPIDLDKDERNNAKAFFGHNQVLIAAVRRKLSFGVEFGDESAKRADGWRWFWPAGRAVSWLRAG